MFGSTSFGGFGGGAATTSQPPSASTSSSLFGSAAPTPSLFGAPKPATSTPSLFGAPPAPTPSAGGGLFGAAAAAAPKPTFGGFGAAPAASSGGGMFGTPAPAPAAAAGGGLFGQQQQGGGGGLFGASTAGGGSLFGAASALAAPAPTTTPAAAPAADQLSKASKFNDLPEGTRAVIEGIESFIRQQVQISDELKARDLAKEVTGTSAMFAQISSEATAVSNMLAQDTRLAAELKDELQVTHADMAKATIIIEGYKNPQQKGGQAKAVANFPFEYFSRKAEEFKIRLANYKATLDQIQYQVDSTHSLSGNPSAIVPTLRAQHTSFMALASALASLDLQLKGLKEDYRVIWRDKTGKVGMDPFRAAAGRGGQEEVRRGMRGLEIR